MRLLRDVLIVCVFIPAALSFAQTKNSVTGQTFRNQDIGVTWRFPDTLVPAAPDELPRDPSGRDHFLLALWDKQQKTPVPLIVVEWDTKINPASLSPSATAQRYLQSLQPGTGFKLSKPTELQMGGRPAWRMDYFSPDDAGQSFDSAIAVPLKDRSLLFIQMSARSEHERDDFVRSLAGAKFDQEK